MSDRTGDRKTNGDFALASYSLPERPRPSEFARAAASALAPPPGFPDELDPTIVPLPTQTPPQPDYSRLPDRVLHSGAVETLIGQNEDLMARLKVNVRRCSTLEARLAEQEQETSDLRRINASLTAQIQIVCEKEGALKSRADSAERERNAIERRARLLEGFRRRVLKWTKARFKRAARAEAALRANEAELAVAKARLARASERLQQIEGARSRDQAALVESYEAKLAAAAAEAERLKSERAYLKERSDKLDEARVRLAEAENRSIFVERGRKELERKLNEETSRLQAEASGFRREAKRLAAELEARKRSEQAAETRSAGFAKKLARSEDQFESLRAVWEDLQRTCESLAARNDALARVNQELARKLREGRAGTEAHSSAQTSAAIENPDRAAALEAARGESFDRIDALLAEIESGFARSRVNFAEDECLPPTPSEPKAAP